MSEDEHYSLHGSDELHNPSSEHEQPCPRDPTADQEAANPTVRSPVQEEREGESLSSPPPAMFPVNLIHEKAERLDLAFLVIGGHAVNVYCEPRATLDVDFLVRKQDQPKWHALLGAEGFKLKNAGENFLQFSPRYGVSFRLDLMMVSDATFAKLRETARRAAWLGTEVLIPSVLNLIALKVHAIRHGPVERKNKDWLDIENLIRAAGLTPSAQDLRDVFHRQGTAELYLEFLKRCAHDEQP